MGRADTATTNFMRQNDVFADAFNFFLYQGDPVINPKQLRELDPAELARVLGVDQDWIEERNLKLLEIE